MQTDVYSEAEECKQTEAGMVWWFTVYLAGMVARERERERKSRDIHLVVLLKFHCVLGGRGVGLN